MFKSYAYGFPRIGRNREFKRSVEAYWAGKIDDETLSKELDNIQSDMISNYKTDFYPVGEITGYDNILDASIMVGIYKKHSSWKEYYDLVRGKNALEITKWFNTNYHYVVPYIDDKTQFSLVWNKPLEEYNKNSSTGAIPFLVGPFTLLKLSKGAKNLLRFYDGVLSAYEAIISELAVKNVSFIHMDEPALVLELNDLEKEFVKKFYSKISSIHRIVVITYYDDIEEETLKCLLETSVYGIGIDFTSNTDRSLRALGKLKQSLRDKVLIAGVVSGRNVWKESIEKVSEFIQKSVLTLGAKEVWVSNGAPLYHLPYTVEVENKLHPSIKERLAFAKEKVEEINYIRDYINGNREVVRWNEYRFDNSWWFNSEVQRRVRDLKEEDFKRSKPYRERVKIQSSWLKLPKFPTTTIGSFPQTEEVRQMRLKYKKGEISRHEYDDFIKKKIEEAIKIQEDIGLDVLVHGEFERSDMVEYFAEKLKGITTTENGWVLSYGTRVYRAPIIYGDVYRDVNLVVDEIVYAQSLTKKPVKAIITGPVTILAWSYGRTDVPESEVAYQIALAILNEVKELENNNIKIIQIDEPAFREKAPIKRRDWQKYFDWSIKAFRLASKASPEVQLHTHMCYSEFGEIIDKIYELDADVISIEATRSGGDILESFEKFKYDHQIGLGVYDVHSPEIPQPDEMRKIVDRSLKVINPNNFWINPDCGLKTRKWDEVIPSLKNMVRLANEMRGK
ncbi:MAG: 5-methyltetrahydropteroyltriglutamate--homocysteine S-methyltransferase [Brevinematales bacterium]|nr:5-methyltetrahydropteroyltriglutamate--homocysteine S-methyltransferase [Brevinematales bacterium]